jgi:diaminohydroxyphosphoribosylaminopyrimidine deaminase/5-amino-6-(5-phosphoribosylamino)uracil reductase
MHLNQRFFIAAREGRPFVLLKAATTLDGRIATRTGDSKWITSVAARRTARRLRRLHDAVAVGIGTVLADDPLLLPQPRLKRGFHRVIFDSDLRLPPSSRLAKSARRSPVWVLARRDVGRRRRALEALGVRVLVQGARGSRVSPQWAMETLWRNGIWSVMVEGGAELLGSFLAARFVDQLAWFRAPMLLGGRSSLSAFGGRGPAIIADALGLRARSRLSGLAGDALVPPTEGLEIWYPG